MKNNYVIKSVKTCLLGMAVLSLSPMALFAARGGSNGNNEDQVTICHYPPGNPANAQTLTVGISAWPAHRDNHSDTLGACAVSANNCDDCAYQAADYAAGGCATTCGHLVK